MGMHIARLLSPEFFAKMFERFPNMHRRPRSCELARFWFQRSDQSTYQIRLIKLRFSAYIFGIRKDSDKEIVMFYIYF